MNAIVRAWERTVRRHATDRAMVQAIDGRSCTFGDIDAGAARLGFDPVALRGRAVVFAMPNGIRWIEFFIAVMRAGGVAVPLDAGEPVAAQRQLATSLRAGFWWDGQQLVPVSGARRYRDCATCLIKLTSGSTGSPRALVFSDAQMLADGRQVTASMGIRRTDLNYALIPLGHSYGLGNLTLPLIAHGVPVVCGAAPLPHAIAADFTRWRPTVFPSVPTVYQALTATELGLGALASLRLAISAGAPLAPDTAKLFAEKFGRRVHAFYGSSETGGIAYDRTGAATLRGGVGMPLRGVAMTVQRTHQLRICSAAVFTLGNPRRRGGHGCWTPPDRARLDQKEGLVLLGRRGTTVKIAGRRVSLSEISVRLRRVPGVRDAWVGVTPGPHPVLGAAVASLLTAGELRAALSADTAAWKIPKKWAVMTEFPVTQRGKTDTRALHARVFRD